MSLVYPISIPFTSQVVDVSYQVPRSLSRPEVKDYKAKITALLKQKNAVMVSHYYVDSDIQDLTDETGGIVADSLEMARFGKNNEAQILVVSGVKFMGETAKLLSPDKKILMPTLDATCSLDVSCPVDEFRLFCAKHPDHQIVVYANTSAEIKAMADWVVTSSIAIDVVAHLAKQGEKIIWAPDRYLGDYIQRKTGAEMILWQGACIVHEEFKGRELAELKLRLPNAQILVHPESPASVIDLAHFVGSTSQLIAYAQRSSAQQFIVATDNRILHKMQILMPNKNFLEAPTAGDSATCKSCAHCPWMAMNSLENLYIALLNESPQIEVAPAIREASLIALNRMLEFPKPSSAISSEVKVNTN